ncbi:RNA pyrophosphohydrolase [Tritonibacter horizontis]|uniref:RNA pyrophosphohydrolase n=1 Tax=Tritonibacter horizontis TaxID=1768241 RepID=A0A132BZE2_9RHOB|nr:RNA pyrophosphohydrolase [Tritonibacter horizontis]
MSKDSQISLTADQIARLPYRPNVGVMLLNAAGDVWVGQRKDRHKNAWQMPQGGIDKGEDARVAALRELEEETGVTPDLVEIIAESDGWLPYDLPHEVVPHFWGGKFRGQEQKWFLLRFLGTDAQINIETDDPEFSAWCWQPVAELVDKVVPFKREVYARVVEEFKTYL